MLAAKAIVFAALVFVVADAAAFPSFFIGAAILHSRAPVSLGDPGVLRAVIGAGLYAAVFGVFAIAIGTLVRHTAGAFTGIIGFVLVLSPMALLLPGNVGQHIHAYLPTVAGQTILGTGQGPHDLMSAWQGRCPFNCGGCAAPPGRVGEPSAQANRSVHGPPPIRQ